jgi:hypothetical protein
VKERSWDALDVNGADLAAHRVAEVEPTPCCLSPPMVTALGHCSCSHCPPCQ